MKKALSVLLAVLMLFSVLGVSSSASSVLPSQYHVEWGTQSTNLAWWGSPEGFGQVVIFFNLNGGTLRDQQIVFDEATGQPTYQSNITGTWVMVPTDPMHDMMLNDGKHSVQLPVVTAPKGYQFDGWECTINGQKATYAANGEFPIPYGAPGMINIKAAYSSADIDEDTMTKVMGILVRVFGTLIGILFYGEAESGIALMENLLAGIF